MHSVAALSSRRVDRVEDTLQRTARPLLRNSERRQRRRQGENLVLSKPSTLTLSGNRHHHVCNLRLRRNRLRTQISNLIRKNLVAIPRALGGLLQATNHLTKPAKRRRRSLNIHLRHRRKLSDSSREVLQVLRRNVHLRAERADLRKISKRCHNLLRRQIRVRLTQLIQIISRTLGRALHVSKCTLLSNTSLRSSRHQHAKAGRNRPVIGRRVASSITNILNRLLIRTQLSLRRRGINAHCLALTSTLLLDHSTLRTASLSLTSSRNTRRRSDSSSLTLRLSACRHTSKLQLSLLQLCRSLDLGKTSSLSALRLHEVPLVPPLLTLQRDSVVLTLHCCLSAKLLSLSLSLTSLRLVQRRLCTLRLILSSSHSISRRRDITHSSSSILQLLNVIIRQLITGLHFTYETTVRRHSLIDTSCQVNLRHAVPGTRHRRQAISNRLQCCRRLTHVLDLGTIQLQRIKNRTTTTRRGLQCGNSRLQRADLLFQSTNITRSLFSPRRIDINVNLNRLVTHVLILYVEMSPVPLQ